MWIVPPSSFSLLLPLPLSLAEGCCRIRERDLSSLPVMKSRAKPTPLLLSLPSLLISLPLLSPSLPSLSSVLRAPSAPLFPPFSSSPLPLPLSHWPPLPVVLSLVSPPFSNGFLLSPSPFVGCSPPSAVMNPCSDDCVGGRSERWEAPQIVFPCHPTTPVRESGIGLHPRWRPE